MWEYISEVMGYKGISFYQLSKATGISQQLISRWKKGDVKPKRENIVKIANYLNVPESYFYTGKMVEGQKEDFTTKDIMLARDINNYDRAKLIRDIMKIQKDKDIEIIELITKKILEGQK